MPDVTLYSKYTFSEVDLDVEKDATKIKSKVIL